jgi:hypothetical protein
MVDLKNYICSVPFEALEIMENRNYMCCASWLLKELPNGVPVKDLWNSDEAIDIRKSVSDGSYKYCDKKQCPFLARLLNLNISNLGPIHNINDINDEIKNSIDNGYIMDKGPKILQFSFDRTCNYKCPSCRVDMIVADSKKIKKINLTIDEIENTYSDSLETIYCSGTADPFASVSYRNYFKNFNPKKYPNLKSIHLHTNASLWNKEMWDSMPNIHKYVHSCEISIDAGSKHTYENITRLGGDWDNLINNLKFISTISSLKSVKCSFVVQQSNYMELKDFLDLMRSIFGSKTKVFFGRITNWGTFSDGQFKIIDVADKSHPEYSLFLNEFKKVAKDPYVFHNMYDSIDLNKSII